MTEKILGNDGLNIRYRIKYGQKNKVLIFLHGGGGSLSSWDVMLPSFDNSDAAIITVDLRGHGLSGRPKEISDYFLEKHAEDILNILTAENFDQVILIGHCLGGMVAATFAAKFP